MIEDVEETEVKLMYFADVYFVSTDTPNHEKYCFCNSLIW
jgi:hypothetical protein